MTAAPAPAASKALARYGRPDGWRGRLYDLIFLSDSPAGRRFDIALVAAILLSILVVVLDSVPAIRGRHAGTMHLLEWAFTLGFTVEYVARLLSVRHPLRYATSFFGIVDLLSVLPTYVSLLVPGSEALLDIRILRLLRVFRIFKLTLYIEEYTRLAEALANSRRKILVFLSVVLMAVLILGTLMYVIEGPQHGYTSIPTAMYWAIVTMTTVGYGDITPHTTLGKAIASFMMLLGWGILAVPTGIVTAEMTALRTDRRHGPLRTARACGACGSEGHAADAQFCKDCGAALPAASTTG
ncbi:ion transporter [Massilia yuzhufengensis]|uniref:Voltage-gated potassium channel n=1 Tax=Massilia yuzhufengensis TaxID=1164594 RepID=A0A1I1H199_9BURK|nr:ion transporter [Massilia yuzhufengensis]SFC15183.1 voltage-gated potassium channel [Massilia yuzhufengensis]